MLEKPLADAGIAEWQNLEVKFNKIFSLQVIHGIIRCAVWLKNWVMLIEMTEYDSWKFSFNCSAKDSFVFIKASEECKNGDIFVMLEPIKSEQLLKWAIVVMSTHCIVLNNSSCIKCDDFGQTCY